MFEAKLSAALVPTKIESIPPSATAAYRPFDVIERIRVRYHGKTLDLRPLIIFDDAHSLHPKQLIALRCWLSQREIRVSRWILTRLDALSPQDVLLEPAVNGAVSVLAASREHTVIRMQNGDHLRRKPHRFRAMAKDMAGRYLTTMDVFNRRSLHSLGDLLPAGLVELPAGKRRHLRSRVDSLQRQRGISSDQRGEIERRVDEYRGKYSDSVRLAALSILFERYAKRSQLNLFDDDSGDLSGRLNVDSAVFEGARIHLLHNYNLPHYFGIDALCDASSDNAEQFLQLAAHLVNQSETQIILGKRPTLTTRIQHDLLRQRARAMVEEWNFPQWELVLRLSDGIARQCLTKSLERNASLGGGAGAFGVPQAEFDTIPTKFRELAQVLQFGVAYNALVLVPNHRTKGRRWCLIELGGVLRLRHGLTLRRGGFLERGVRDLRQLLADD